MDWRLAISRNREALLRVVAALFALGAMAGSSLPPVLPRSVYFRILRLLRPTESAVRRLIFIAARGLVLALASQRLRVDFAKIIVRNGTVRQPAFCLIDPLKRFVPSVSLVENDGYEDYSSGDGHDGAGHISAFPRVSLPGFLDPDFSVPVHIDTPDTLDTSHLARRLLALKLALENLPKQARRLARWQARRQRLRQQFPRRRGRFSPFRPGRPPGFCAHQSHEVYGILHECNALMRDIVVEQNTS